MRKVGALVSTGEVWNHDDWWRCGMWCGGLGFCNALKFDGQFVVVSLSGLWAPIVVSNCFVFWCQRLASLRVHITSEPNPSRVQPLSHASHAMYSSEVFPSGRSFTHFTRIFRSAPGQSLHSVRIYKRDNPRFPVQLSLTA